MEESKVMRRARGMLNAVSPILLDVYFSASSINVLAGWSERPLFLLIDGGTVHLKVAGQATVLLKKSQTGRANEKDETLAWGQKTPPMTAAILTLHGTARRGGGVSL